MSDSFRRRQRRVIAALGAAAILGTLWATTAAHAGAYGSTIPMSIASTMTLSRSHAEVEFPVTATCDPIGAYASFLYVTLDQGNGASGLQLVEPLVCNSSPHTYDIHVFTDQANFKTGTATATATAKNIASNFVEQDGSASSTTTLSFGDVDVAASNVVGAETHSTYSVSIGGPASLAYPTQGNKGYARTTVPITVTCTPSTTTTSPWAGAALEQGEGANASLANDQSNQAAPAPTLICDGSPHTYDWQLWTSSTQPPAAGYMSVAVWIEGDLWSPQGSHGAINPDAVATVLAPKP